MTNTFRSLTNSFYRYLLFCLLMGVSTLASHSQDVEPYKGNESLNYEEVIDSYMAMSESSETADLMEVGITDVGQPLYLFVINKTGNTNPGDFESDRARILINNGIHPGEPCGIDASVKLAEDLLSGNNELANLLDSTIVCIIPIYNVGGSLNRGCCSRANQNGPAEYGFRGNARNLDLNRDFIKADAANSQSFAAVYHQIKPHVFVDTHTSNGADYQYVMTMITTQPDKATGLVGEYIRDEMNPGIFEIMDERGWKMTPYVNTMGRTPEKGISDFLETPRYSTGYTALFNTIGFTSETHMFKPFAERVESTYQFEVSILEYMQKNAVELKALKAAADLSTSKQKRFPLHWKLDTAKFREIEFDGYEAEFTESTVTGLQRMKYNRDKPWTDDIRYYDTFIPSIEVDAPRFYVIPQAWSEVIEKLQRNQVEMSRLNEDRIMEVEAYHITDYETTDRVYEGHYLHSGVEVERVREEIQFRTGDYVIEVNQPVNRYIVETLEPQAVDAFFAWNEFDSILQQKEWFSDYVFEEKAAEMLEGNDGLRIEFEAKKAEDAEFASSHWWMLYWLYQRSEHFENSFNRYPVYRYNGSF
jgi:hypothetical protein